MKNFLLFLLLLLFYACTDSQKQMDTMQAKIDSLEKKLDASYTPGFGEFMSNIQVHHAKLWFAGINRNWELADFEINEIKETLQALKEYQSERVETKSLIMIYPALDSVNTAVQKQDANSFKSKFKMLTNTCNQCHRSVNYGFNDVKIPESPPFSNQIFKIENK
jgi:hypothetical protein